MEAPRVQALILLLIALPLSGRNAFGQNPQDDASKISVIPVQSKAVTITQQYLCKIHSRRHIEVRAPAEGYVAAILIKMGQRVKAGEIMFELVPILYKARLDAKQAERDIAELEFNNVKKLAEKRGVSQVEVKLSAAKLAKAQAEVDLASAELNFTKIRAPFDGLVGRMSRQQGSFVLKGETLTTFSDNSVMWAYFNIPEAGYLEYMASGSWNKTDPQIELVLANGNKFQQTGKIGAIEAEFNANTGGIAFRADFPNPDGLLRHGQAGTVLINRVLENAIVIPHRATFETLGKRYVYVVDKDHVARQRAVIIQNETGDLFIVRKGVEVGDKIVLEGVRLVRDGDKVE